MTIWPSLHPRLNNGEKSFHYTNLKPNKIAIQHAWSDFFFWFIEQFTIILWKFYYKTIEWLLSKMEIAIESRLRPTPIRTHLGTAIQSHSKVLFLYTFLLVKKNIFTLIETSMTLDV